MNSITSPFITQCKYTAYKLYHCGLFSKDLSTLCSKSRGTNSWFNIASIAKVHIFSEAQNSSQVHHNISLAALFAGLCVPTGFFCMTLRVDVVVPPMYFVKWTITFWLSSLIPRAHAPIVYFIPLLWVLCISEIAKIVDPGLWNSTSFMAWITSSSCAKNMLRAPEGIKRQGSGECCLQKACPLGWHWNFHLENFTHTNPTVTCQ